MMNTTALTVTEADQRLLDGGTVDPTEMLGAKLEEAGFEHFELGYTMRYARPGLTVTVTPDYDDGTVRLVESRNGAGFSSVLDVIPETMPRVLAFVAAAVAE